MATQEIKPAAAAAASEEAYLSDASTAMDISSGSEPDTTPNPAADSDSDDGSMSMDMDSVPSGPGPAPAADDDYEASTAMDSSSDDDEPSPAATTTTNLAIMRAHFAADASLTATNKRTFVLKTLPAMGRLSRADWASERAFTRVMILAGAPAIKDWTKLYQVQYRLRPEMGYFGEGEGSE